VLAGELFGLEGGVFGADEAGGLLEAGEGVGEALGAGGADGSAFGEEADGG
jgi:hypothetical protein